MTNDQIIEKTLLERGNFKKKLQADGQYRLNDYVVPDIKACIEVIERSNWISVNERLPTENDGRVSWGVNAYKKYILVNIVSRGVGTCRFNLTDKCFETADEVTHWQSLPSPPNEMPS